ncbi:MAG: hypothetical protein RIT81_38200 [Deltaproteobacteria bacterium]
MIGLEDLKAHHDFDASHQRVEAVVDHIVNDPIERVRVLANYTSWNGFFGAGVAALAGKIGRSRRMFLDPDQPIRAVADRSVLVASYFFDAARDEFDDSTTQQRDTHRCLAQAFIAGLIKYGAEAEGVAPLADVEQVNALLVEPEWLKSLNDQVAYGYGARGNDTALAVFRAMGYHLGSEVLADVEFSVLDEKLTAKEPALTAYLKNTELEVAGEKHVPYAWLEVHSGHGGGAEADHFEWAARGVERAFDYTPKDQHEELRHQVVSGFEDFAKDHDEFFARVLKD